MIKKITIPFSKNSAIIGDLHINQDSKTLLILCHGFNDSKDTYQIRRMAELLENNFNVFRFSFLDKSDLIVQSKNLFTVVKHFSPQYRITVVGPSLGGLIVLLSTVNNKHIDRLILINPFVYFLKKIAWRFRMIIISLFVSYLFNKDIRSNISFYFKMLKPDLINLPTLLIVATKDKIVSPSHGKTLYYNLSSRQKKLILDDNFDHGLTKETHLKKTAKHIINWLENET